MKRIMQRTRLVVVAILAIASIPAFAADKPLKIYILAGQSNMQGYAKAHTLAGVAMDPETKPLYDLLVDKDGKPRVHENVYMAAFTQSRRKDSERSGTLTVGYGSGLTSDDLGPELAFGATLGRDLQEPILIIKTAWGGKSLRTDFRPPSAGPIQYTDHEKKRWKKEELEGRVANHNKQKGKFYDLMMKHVNTVLKDPGKYCPAYDPKQGYEIAGFVWFQGFNDLIALSKHYDWYESLLCHLIRDVRKDLKTPKMPFVIGVMGVYSTSGKMKGSLGPFQKAMAAPAKMPEFKGNVIAVNTADYNDKRLMAFSDHEYHVKKIQRYKTGKYAELAKKMEPIKREINALWKEKSKKNGPRIKELEAKLRNVIWPEEDREYRAKNESNKYFHYYGSAKVYSRIGEAFAKAITERNSERK